MIEFDDYGNRLTDAKALEKRIRNRLSMMKNEIPYLSMGLWGKLFTYEDITPVILDALSDLQLTGIQINDSQTRIKVANLTIDISNVLSRLEEA